MLTPIILKTGSTSGPGQPGEGSNNLVIGETVTITDTEVANAGLPHFTEFEDVPIGSALTALADEATETPSFVPDVTGSYRIKMTVDGILSAVEVHAVPLPRTLSRIPSFQETSQWDGGGNSKGWHEAITWFMRLVDSDYQLTPAHAIKHIRGGVDEIDGDKVDIDWAPTNYVRNTTPPEVSNVEQLTAHLAGIDTLFGRKLGAASEALLRAMRVGDTASHDSSTPLIVSQFSFDPTPYVLTPTALSIKFAAVAGNGAAGINTMARLYNLTDGEYVGVGVSFTSQTPTLAEETLTVGAAAGNIKPSAKVYEVRIWVVAPSDPSHTINLGSAELRVFSSIPA